MRWIVRPGHGRRLRDVLERARADPDAVPEGRVFIGRRRARSADESVRDGDVVEIAPPRPAAQPARILWQGEDLVGVDKDAGIPTIADHAGAKHALVAVTAVALGVPESRLHPTSRLDRDVSGVVVFALTPAAAQRLVRAREAGRYERRYVALSARTPTPPSGQWEAPIGRAADPRLRRVGGAGALPARTRYAVSAASAAGPALLAVAPVTGRTHQIRVHAANAGVPLLGDRAYGGPVRLTLADGRVLEPRRIALHAARVVVRGGGNGTDRPTADVCVVAPVPVALLDLWAALGGEASAWQLATSCNLASF